MKRGARLCIRARGTVNATEVPIDQFGSLAARPRSFFGFSYADQQRQASRFAQWREKRTPGLFHHVVLDILPNVFGGKARTSSDVTKMEKFHQKHEKLRRDGGSG